MGLFSRRKSGESQPEKAERQPDRRDSEDRSLDEAAHLYRTKYMMVVPAGDDVLLHDPELENPVVLPAFELDLLTQCTYFAPVEEHATAAATRTGLPAEGVALRLYEMVDRGLLVSKQEVMARARATVDAGTDSLPTLNRVAVLTNYRKDSLTRCVRSYRERYGGEIEITVFDDAADRTSRDENQRAAAEAGAGGRTFYVGADEKRRLVSELAGRSGVDEQVVSAALIDFDACDWHAGANRNAVLLDAAGEAVLMVDDDTTARATRLADAADGLRFSSRGEPWTFHFFSDLEEALSAAVWEEVDLLDWHRRFLGKSLAACAFGSAVPNERVSLDADAHALDLDLADAALVNAFARGRGRIAVTSMGLAGDSGMGVPINFLWVHGTERERLLENYESYRATRAVHRSAHVTTVSSTGFLMTPNVAFDVRDIVPPFPPTLRNEDGAFGKILRACAPQSYIAYLPWAVEHIPAGVRSEDFGQFQRFIARVHANSIIRDLADSYEATPGVTDQAVRLGAFGRYLTALGTMPPGEFDAFARHQIAVAVSRRIEALTRTIERFDGRPESWAQDCSEMANEGVRSLTEDELMVDDLPAATRQESQRRFQRHLYRFGCVVEAWPALLDAARNTQVAKPL